MHGQDRYIHTQAISLGGNGHDGGSASFDRLGREIEAVEIWPAQGDE